MILSLQVGPLTLDRGGRRLVHNLQFTLLSSRYLTLTGDNGSGKTTLLRLLAGLQMESNLVSATDLPDSVFYYSHQLGLRAELPVLTQLQLSLQMLGQSFDPTSLRVLLDQVGLAKKSNVLVGQLSQGQQRRLLLALMSVSQCQCWLIDEPLNALDQEARLLFAGILAHHLENGGTAIVATHQSLPDLLPVLAPFHGGELCLQAGAFVFQESKNALADNVAPPVANQTIAQLPSPASTAHNKRDGWWSLQREIAVMMARPADVVWPTVFYLIMVSVFPMAVGAQADLLERIAIGVCWMSAMLTVLMATSRLFEQDFNQGALAQMHVAKCAMANIVLGKVLAFWLVLGLPIMLISLPVGLLYHLNLVSTGCLSVSLGLGLVSLISTASLFASLALMARQAQVVCSLLAIPIFVPLLIFGSAAASSASVVSSPMSVLLALAALSLLVVPLVTAKVLQLALD